MSDPIDDIDFLARSPHRVTVLEALADAPRTRHELKERADVSRVTIRRILEDLEERGWIDADRGQYEATAAGRVVAREFARLRSNLSVADRLDTALAWLPTEEFDFDLARLRDAEVLDSRSWAGQTEVIRQTATMVEGTDRIQGTAIGFSEPVVEAIESKVVPGECTFDVVVDETCLGIVRKDPGLAERFRAMLASGNAALARYRGDAPLHMVMTFDDLVSICGHIDEGPPPGSLQSTDPAVREWARAYYETARSAAEPVGVDAITPEGT